MELMRELLAVERAMGRSGGSGGEGAAGDRSGSAVVWDGGDGYGGADAAASGDAGAAVCAGAAGEIAPAMVHPVLGLTVGEMLGRLKRWELENGVLG